MPQVFGYVYMRVGRDRDLAEDLVSEIFLKALEKFDSFDEKQGSFRSWIFQITRNHLIDHYKSSEQKGTTSLDELENVLPDSQNVEEDFLRDVEKEALYEAMETLDSEKKEMVILRFISGYSYQEMSNILGKDENTLRVTIFRTLDVLKRKLYSLHYHG